MKYLSLFTGIGGFELGIQQAYVVLTHGKKNRQGKSDPEKDVKNWQRLVAKKRKEAVLTGRSILQLPHGWLHEGAPTSVGYSEIDKYATQTYSKHFPEHKNYGDITKIAASSLPDFDLLVGGFPCQSFSIAGKRKGFEDVRGTLFFEICRIIKEKQPRLLLLENVKGLLSHDNGQTFTTIISTLDELGYDLQWQVLNSKDFGVPQNRERVFIVGHLRGTSRPEVFPIGQSDGIRLETRKRAKEEIAPCLGAARGGADINDQFVHQRPRGKNSGGKHNLAPTLTGKSYQDNNTLNAIRRLTPTECERLQGFPDNWTAGVSDTQRYKMCGNAVTVNVIQAIMEKVLYD